MNSHRLFVQAWLTCSLVVAAGYLILGWLFCSAHQQRLRSDIDSDLAGIVHELAEAVRPFDLSEPTQPVLDVVRTIAKVSKTRCLLARDGRLLADSECPSLACVLQDRAPLERPPMPPGSFDSTELKAWYDGGNRQFDSLTRNWSDESHGPMQVRVLSSVEAWQRPSREYSMRLAAWGLPGLVLVISLIGWILYCLTDPLVGVAEVVRQLAQGDNPRRLRMREGHPLAEIGSGLNRVGERLTLRENALRERDVHQDAVLASMHDGVIAVDRKQRVMFANVAAKRLFQREQVVTEGRPLLEAFRIHRLHQLVSESLDAQGTARAEMELDGPVTRSLSLQATPMPGDPCPGVVVVVHNITELRRLETMRQEFVANVSHELKTPLSSIKAYAETLRNGAIQDADNCMRFLVQIEEHADRLDCLIADLLSLARIEAGHTSYLIESLDVEEAVRQRVADHQAAAQTNSIDLKSGPVVPDLCVTADKECLRQVLDNLINNAIKYTRDGGSVIVRSHAEDKYGVIEVEDNGIGISEADQQRVFERFFRVDKARSREMGGTGLGLSIVKHQVNFLGGDVYVRSQLGQGSTFGVRLPRTPRRSGAPMSNAYSETTL